MAVKSIGAIKNTALRRALLIVLVPIGVLPATILCALIGIAEEMPDFWRCVENAWRGSAQR